MSPVPDPHAEGFADEKAVANGVYQRGFRAGLAYRDDELRNALLDAVTSFRDAHPNTAARCDGLNAIIVAAMALVDSYLPTADDVRGILAGQWVQEPPGHLDAATRQAVIASQPLCASCGHNKVHHFGATSGKIEAPDERRCWVDKCRCKGWVVA